MAFARDRSTATAGQTDFTISFPYLDRDHVKVKVNGVDKVETTDYTFVSDGLIRFNSGLAAGDQVLRYRDTSQDQRIVDYSIPGTLTESDLDNDSQQAFNMAQEAIDIANESIVRNDDNLWDGQSVRLMNLANPVAAQDAVTKAYGDSNYGGAAANSAATSATNAAASASSAASSAANAASSATSASNSAADAEAAAANVEGVYSVLKFGADPTGAADSTSAFQQAVDVANSGIVFVPAGNYKLLGTVTITKPVHIIGAGGDHTFSAGGGANIGFGDGSNDFFVINSHDVTLENLNFHGDGGGNRNTAGACGIKVGKNTVSLTAALSINSGTNGVTGVGTAFTADDIGKRIVIVGAGIAGVTGNEPLVTTITAVASATSITVNDNASATVSNADGHYGHTYLGTRLTNITTNSFHDAGVHFISAAHWRVTGCALKGTKAGLRIENRVGPDYGDSMLDNNTFYADATIGKGVEWLSSGGLKVENNKFLDGAYNFYMDWTLGLSGNLNFSNNSLENYITTAIRMGGTRQFTRANIVNNTIGGGEKAVDIVGSATWLKNLAINDNTISVATAIPAIQISYVAAFEIKDNVIDGNGSATYGVVEGAGTSLGLVGRNQIVNMAAGETQISGTSTAKEYETGTFAPTLTFATPGNLSVTYSQQVGRYVKRGRKVSVQIYIATSAFTHTTASGNLTISGLPYAARAAGNPAIGAMSFTGVTKANYTQLSPFVNVGTSSILVLASGSGQALAAVSAADMPSGGSIDIRITIEYEVEQ